MRGLIKNHTNMTEYDFWKENKLDQKFTLRIEEFKEKFLVWMQTKEKSWLEHYYANLILIFITDPSGLNAAFENGIGVIEEIEALIKDAKWKYLNSIGIN